MLRLFTALKGWGRETERGGDRDRQKVTGRKKTERRTGTEGEAGIDTRTETEAAREEEEKKKTQHRGRIHGKKGEMRARERRSRRLLTQAERKMGGEVEGSCRWTVETSKQYIQQRSRG